MDGGVGGGDVYRSLVESAADPMVTIDASGRYLFANPAALALHGGQVVGKTLADFFPPDVARLYAERIGAVIATGEQMVVEEPAVVDGRRFWFSSIIQPMRDGAGHVVAAHVITRDITAMRATEHARRAGAERLRQAVDVAHIGIFEHDHRTDHLYMSPEQRRINGLAPDVELVIGRPIEPGERAVNFSLTIHPDDLDRVLAAVNRSHDPAGDGSYDVEHRFTAADGTTRWVRTRAQTFFEGEGAARRPVRTVGASRDITDDKRAAADALALQAQLSEAQKMESVGRLAGGVAHDFNNMLNVVLGWSGIALADVTPDHPLEPALREIQTAGERAASLTRQLLAFARRQPTAPKVLNLNDRVSRSLTMLGRMLGEDVRLTWNPGQALWAVRIDPTQIDQVLTSLATNARDAIQGVGRVAITTGNVTIADTPGAARANPSPGEYILLRVTDDGGGMDAETQAHIFEPFYTTKPAGAGTGLGLATVYGIVRQNDGVILLESAVGEGTTVSIYLPRFTGPGTSLDLDEVHTAPMMGREAVLLVEDEPMMLELSKTMLHKLGYTVIPAASPEAAMTLADRHAGGIDLLFTDVVMPTMSGIDLAAHLVAKYPNLKCLFASGHFSRELISTGDLEGVRFLHKPFTLADLAANLRAALDGDE